MNGFDKKRVACCIDFPINVHVHKGFMVSVTSQWNSGDSNMIYCFFRIYRKERICMIVKSFISLNNNYHY